MWRWLGADALDSIRGVSGKCLQQVVFGRVDSRNPYQVMEGKGLTGEKVADVAAAEASPYPQGGRGPAELS